MDDDYLKQGNRMSKFGPFANTACSLGCLGPPPKGSQPVCFLEQSLGFPQRMSQIFS